MHIIPDPPPCGQPATIRIEIYIPTAGNPHAEIAGHTYACGRCRDQQIADISTAGLTPFQATLAPCRTPRCGVRVLFSARVS
jgi:DNA-directed RNA polymerase subunit RPC12/RpoP